MPVDNTTCMQASESRSLVTRLVLRQQGLECQQVPPPAETCYLATANRTQNESLPKRLARVNV